MKKLSIVMAREKKGGQKKKNGEEKKFEERVLLIRRVSKKTPGGNTISFSALVVVGDKKGKVGIGLGKGLEVPQAIKKAIRRAKKQLIKVPVYRTTLPHDVRIKYKSAEIILKPAPQGAGLKVGSVLRTILNLAGILNASGKILRSRNKITNAYAVIEGLKKLKSRDE